MRYLMSAAIISFVYNIREYIMTNVCKTHLNWTMVIFCYIRSPRYTDGYSPVSDPNRKREHRTPVLNSVHWFPVIQSYTGSTRSWFMHIKPYIGSLVRTCCCLSFDMIPVLPVRSSTNRTTKTWCYVR